MKPVFLWSPLQTICRYLRLCYARKKGARKWTYFGIIRIHHWLLEGKTIPLALKTLLFPCPHSGRSSDCSQAPVLLSEQPGQRIPAGNMLRVATKSKWLMSFLLTDTIRPDLHASLQDPSKVFHRFWHSTKEKHRNNLIWPSFSPCMVSLRTPKNHKCIILPLISCRFSNSLSWVAHTNSITFWNQKVNTVATNSGWQQIPTNQIFFLCYAFKCELEKRSIFKYLIKSELFLYTMPDDYIPLYALLWNFTLKYLLAFSCLLLKLLSLIHHSQHILTSFIVMACKHDEKFS